MNATFTELTARLLQGSATDIGKRPNQEDRCAICEYVTADGRSATLALVADGIGGHNSGEMASEAAVQRVPRLLLQDPPAASETTRRLAAALQEAGEEIYRESLRASERAGMGTTCTALVVIDRRLYLAHAGDTRAYLLRGGQLYQLTVDHTWAEEAIRAGRLPEEIKSHPNRGVIMRYLGIDPNVDVDTRHRTPEGELVDGLQGGPLFLEPGDTLLLTSDGVSDPLDSHTLAECMAYSDCNAGAQALVRMAAAAGSTDNMTAVVLRLPGGVVVAPPKPAPAAVAGRRSLTPVLAVALALLAVAAAAALLLNRSRPAAQVAAVIGSTPDTAAATLALAATSTREADRGPIAGGGVAIATTAPPTLAALSDGDVVTMTNTVTAVLAGEPTVAPTFTAAPTRARPPTLTPRPSPTLPAPTGSAGIGGATGAPLTGGVDLLLPAEGERIVGESAFSWLDQPGFQLGPNEQYELVIWRPGETGVRDGRSPVGGTTIASVAVNLVGVESALRLSPGGQYYWGVRLLRAGERVRMLSGPRLFTYDRPHTGENGGGGEPAPTPTPLCAGTDCNK